MDYVRIIEIAGTVILTLAAMYGRELVAKTNTKNRILALEEALRDIKEGAIKDVKNEISKLDETLNKTNQFLASTHATTKGLAAWLERTEDRLNNL